MQAARPDIEWIVAAHPKCVPPASNSESVHWIPVPEIEGSPLGVFSWYEFLLPRMIRKYQADVLFSQTNYLPRRRLRCATMLLVQHAGHFSNEFDLLMKAHLNGRFAQFFWTQKKRWVRRSAQAADILTVQTAALAEAISARTARPKSQIAVIPHGPGIADHRLSARSVRRVDLFKIGYTTKWGVQKNFETLFAAAQQLMQAGYRFKIVLTLDSASQPASAIMDKAAMMGLQAIIENHGEISQQQVSRLYDEIDIFVFPSICESFGFPMVEAMACGIPIVVANTKENREVAGDAALVFDPFDAIGLAQHLANIMDDTDERAKRSELSLAAGRKYSWEAAASKTVAALASLA
jgi:glycosyltransferase involved in cell wall biosynthesis